MKKITILSIVTMCVLLFGCTEYSDQISTPNPEVVSKGWNNYDLNFSTFIGGSGEDDMGDITVDKQGYIYVTGCTSSSNFPTTSGAYDNTFNGRHGGKWYRDGYVMKFNPKGNLIWSTYIGGPSMDLTYSIGVDDKGFIYVSGVGGRNFPTTANAFQPNKNKGTSKRTNAIIVKLKPDGSDIEWSSYFGTPLGTRDLDIGPSGDVYVIGGYVPSLNQEPYPSSWLTNAFQNTPSGNQDAFVARIKSDGTRVVWGTYLGGSDFDSADGSIAVDDNGFVYVATTTNSTDIPTPNGYDTTHNGAKDTYVAKLTPDGSKVIWGTYLGGTKDDWILGKHGIVLDSFGNVYVASGTESDDFPSTQGAFDTTFNGRSFGKWEQKGDLAITKFTTDGKLVASSFIGGRYRDGAEGIALDQNGNVYLAIFTYSNNFPVTTGAYQSTYNGNRDGAFFKLSSDLSKLLYSSYMGTSGLDGFRAVSSDSNGNFIAAGVTESKKWPVYNAYQNSYAGGRLDSTLIKFDMKH